MWCVLALAAADAGLRVLADADAVGDVDAVPEPPPPDDFRFQFFLASLIFVVLCSGYYGYCLGKCTTPPVFQLSPADVRYIPHLDGLTAEELQELIRGLKLKGKFDQMDFPTKALMYLVKKAHQKWDTGQYGATELDATLDIIDQKRKLRMVNHGVGGFHTPHLDEDFAPPGFTELLGIKALNDWPFDDKNLQFASVEEGFVYRQKHMRDVAPPMVEQVDRWEDVESDKAISRMAFYGCFVLCLQRVGQPQPCCPGACWVVDTTHMSKFAVRDEFEKYGAAAYFDRKQKLLGIWWCHGNKYVEPGDRDWEHVKWAWKCSTVTWLTYYHHLVHTHWILSNGVNTAARECLSNTHPIRRFLEPHFFRTALINTRAGITLMTDGGFLIRAAATTVGSHFKLSEYCSAKWDYTLAKHPEQIKRQGIFENELPYAEDGMALWRLFQRYADGYLDLFYPFDQQVVDDVELHDFWHKLEHMRAPEYTFGLPELSKEALSELLTSFLWTVTGYHEIAGNIQDFVMHPAGAGGQIRPGQTMSNVQNFTQLAGIQCITALKMPGLLNDWKRVYLMHDDEVYRKCCQLHDDLQASLQELSDTIQRKNTDGSRKHAFSFLDPTCLECSLSL